VAVDVEAGQAVGEFCRAHHARLFGTLRLYCGDAGLAEELTQEALALAVRQWPKVRVMESPAGWLFRVGLNLANSSFRRRSAERRAAGRAGSRSVVHTDPDSPTILAVRDAVRALPPRQREVVILRYFLDLSVRDAAAHMGCAEGTVKGFIDADTPPRLPSSPKATRYGSVLPGVPAPPDATAAEPDGSAATGVSTKTSGVGLAGHNTNLAVAAHSVRLSSRHTKIRRDGYKDRP
jgi:RNA polymerase sigma factor (sigma-70 family)